MNNKEILFYTILTISFFLLLKQVCGLKEGMKGNCPPGFRHSLKIFKCEECPGGTYQTTDTESGISICSPCPPDHYSMRGSTKCVEQLDPNQNMNDFELKSRYTCIDGYKSVWENGNFRCCEIGEDCNNSSGHVQAVCGTGTYEVSDGKGGVWCRNCSIGEYQDEENKNACKVCPDGTYQDRIGQSLCKPCPTGSYSGPGSDKCIKCPIGSYQDEEGQSLCKYCDAGSYQDEEGQSLCKYCQAGTYQDKEGETSCKTCENNWKSTENSISCTLKAGKCPVQGGEVDSCDRINWFRTMYLSADNCTDFYVKNGDTFNKCVANNSGECVQSKESCTLDQECSSNGININNKCICSGNSYDFDKDLILRNSLGYHPNINYYTGNTCQLKCPGTEDWDSLSVGGDYHNDAGCPCGKGSPSCSGDLKCKGETMTDKPDRFCYDLSTIPTLAASEIHKK